MGNALSAATPADLMNVDAYINDVVEKDSVERLDILFSFYSICQVVVCFQMYVSHIISAFNTFFIQKNVQGIVLGPLKGNRENRLTQYPFLNVSS